MLTARAFPSIGRVLRDRDDTLSRSASGDGASVRTASLLGPGGAAAIDTAMARHGSNFGLPIALHLVRLMKGSVGISEVGVAWCGVV